MNQFKIIKILFKLLRTESCTEFGPENINHNVRMLNVCCGSTEGSLSWQHSPCHLGKAVKTKQR
jgi:hypothetical protein